MESSEPCKLLNSSKNFISPLFVKGGGGAKISNETCQWGEMFSKILVGGTKKGGDSIFCGTSVGEACQGWSIFHWSVAKITFRDLHFTVHKFSCSCYVMIDHHVILIFYIFLLLFSSTSSSGFYPIFTIHKIDKCEHTFEK